MPSMRKQTDPRLPTLPTGVEVASYATYLEAQQAVDRLSDEAFDVRAVTIVGTDLRMVERITGRLTYARVAGLLYLAIFLIVFHFAVPWLLLLSRQTKRTPERLDRGCWTFSPHRSRPAS